MLLTFHFDIETTQIFHKSADINLIRSKLVIHYVPIYPDCNYLETFTIVILVIFGISFPSYELHFNQKYMKFISNLK